MTPAQRLPAFQFYPADWRKDPGVQALDYEARGVWFELILLMHESDDRGKLLLNGAPIPDEALARILGIEQDRLKQIVSKLEAYGVTSRDSATNALMNRRMVRDEALRQVRREAGATGGSRSKGGGRPPKTSKQEAKPKQETTSSSSSSSSKKTDTSDRVVELWSVFVDELGGKPPIPKLTPRRGSLLEKLYLEQLKPLDRDPVAAFRGICGALKRSEYHMSTRTYQMPESFLRDAERREQWTHKGLALMNGAGGADDRRSGKAALDAIDNAMRQVGGPA